MEGKLVERVSKGKDPNHEHVHQEDINHDLLDENFDMDIATTNCERCQLIIENVCDETNHLLTHLNQCVTTKENNLEEVEFHGVGALKHSNVEDKTFQEESFEQRIPLVDEVIETSEVARNTTIIQDNKEIDNSVNHACLVYKGQLQALDIEIERARSFLNVREDIDVHPHQLRGEEHENGHHVENNSLRVGCATTRYKNYKSQAKSSAK